MLRYPQIAVNSNPCKDMDNKMRTGVCHGLNGVIIDWLCVHFWPPVRKHGAAEKLKKVSSDQTLDLFLCKEGKTDEDC